MLGFLGRSTFQEDRSRELGNNVTQSFLNLPQSTPGGEIKQLPKLPPEIGAIKQMFQPGYPNYPPKTEGRPKTGTFSVSRLVCVNCITILHLSSRVPVSHHFSPSFVTILVENIHKHIFRNSSHEIPIKCQV